MNFCYSELPNNYHYGEKQGSKLVVFISRLKIEVPNQKKYEFRYNSPLINILRAGDTLPPSPKSSYALALLCTSLSSPHTRPDPLFKVISAFLPLTASFCVPACPPGPAPDQLHAAVYFVLGLLCALALAHDHVRVHDLFLSGPAEAEPTSINL